MHRCTHEGVLVLNTKKFCVEMIHAVERWLKFIETQDEVVERINALFKIHHGPSFSYESIR